MNKLSLANFPSGWDLKRIEEICDVKGRVGWKGYTKEDLRKNGPLALGAMHIDKNNKLDLSQPVYLSREKYEESPEIMVNKGDIILAQRGSLGKVTIIDKEIGEATINPSMVLIKNIKINNLYLYYSLCGDQIQNVINNETSQTSIPMISQAQIKNFVIPIPSKKEQEKIADILSTVDGVIERTEAIIEQTEIVKKGLMQQLLTKGIGHTKFKITEIGEIPEEWAYVTLEDITIRVTDGAHKSPPTFEGGVPIATVENMRDDYLDIKSCRTISIEDFQQLLRNSCAPEKYDVLLSKDGTIGKTLVFNQEEKVVLLSSIAIIRPNLNKLRSEYLMYYLQSHLFYWNLEKFRSGSAIKRIVLKDIKRLAIPLPPIDEQRKIALYLESLDQKIKFEIQKLSRLQAIKKGLMQVLLTGEVQVKVHNKEVTTS
jgi:type I restriction enzyme, S subunit